LYYFDHAVQGPLTLDEVKQQIALGTVQSDTQVCMEGEAAWQTFEQLEARLKA
jgi:hypothetical protein